MFEKKILVGLMSTFTVTLILIIYLNPDSKSIEKKVSCAHLPKTFETSNDYNWQVQKTSIGTFYLLNAYLDDRYNGETAQNFIIRIIGMFNKIKPRQKFFCQVWYDKFNEPLIVEASLDWIWKDNWGKAKTFYQPYLISCKLSDDRIPISVSLTEKKCEVATNNLKVVYEKLEEKKDFVVCVKGLNFPYDDRSVRLAEWIEIVRILGGDKIHFYQFHVHPNVTKLLNYYIEQDVIDVTSISLVGDVSNSPYNQSKYLKEKIVERRLQEVLPFNDCLYKYIYKYKFVVLLDIDEVIAPVDGDWFTLMEILQKEQPNKPSYVARNVYFFDNLETNPSIDIPNYMHMLRHVERTSVYCKPGDFVKGFHDTRKVLALYNHISLICSTKCENSEINVKIAHLQHYRKDCVKEVPNCEEMKRNIVIDSRLWNFKKEVIEKVTKTLKDLGHL